MSSTDPDRTVDDDHDRYDDEYDDYGERATGARVDEDARYENRGDDDSDGIMGLSFGALLLIGGILLFLFPEPATSTVGIILAIVGGVMLIAGAMD
ncbi:hypothetical protein ACFQMA_02220 [Halosimplex aquaticum]|uniref:Uncharacterized protein n=1 Tax=Halosimplex aquaticum TaxID=3026162 RepID=A0ABD5XYT6_9EURY|nr:hypothetical protein [Halosimplex aquaticum]